MASSSLLRNPALYWAVAVVALLSGASLVYVSIKAPFFWGVLYYPGVVLLGIWVLSIIAGVLAFLARGRLER